MQIMETVSNNMGQIEIRTPEDAQAMIDMAQKIIELRDTIEMDPNADGHQVGGRSAEPLPNLGAFRANIVEGGNVPG